MIDIETPLSDVGVCVMWVRMFFRMLVAVAGRSLTMLGVKNERCPLVAVVVCDVRSSEKRL